MPRFRALFHCVHQQFLVYTKLQQFRAMVLTFKALSLIVIFGAFLDGGNCQLPPDTHKSTFVDPDVILVKQWEGWGTSLAWWADVLGASEKQQSLETVLNALFAPNELNLNIVRYAIGGTNPGSTTCEISNDFRPGGATQSYKDSAKGKYDWTRDSRQRTVLLKAKLLGVDTFEAYSSSPPQWTTVSKCSKGSEMSIFPPDFLHANLNLKGVDNFVDYVTEVIRHFNINYGIKFTTYSPFDEPSGVLGIGGWDGKKDREGCNMQRSTMLEVVQKLSEALRNKSLSHVSISGSDEANFAEELKTQQYFLKHNVSHLIEKVNVHASLDLIPLFTPRDRLARITKQQNNRLWMTKMDWKGRTDTMKQSLAIATQIIKDLKQLRPSAWLLWQAVQNINEWGLINVSFDDNDNSTIQYNLAFHAMMQFTKYIRKGFSIIQVNDDDSIAAFNAKTKELVIVVVNPNDEESGVNKTIEYDLGLFKTLGKGSARRTSLLERHKRIFFPSESIGDTKTLKYEALPSASITTFLIEDATTFEDQLNIVRNGDFEGVTYKPWVLEGSNRSVKRATNFAYNGNFSGNIDMSIDASFGYIISQEIQAPVSGKYYLTAACSTNGFRTVLGVGVNGISGTKNLLISRFGFHLYGISFEAKRNETVRIYMQSRDQFNQAFIDDVVLHYPPQNTPTPDTGNENNSVAAQTTINILIFFGVLFAFIYI